jgi:hypothetical protein
MKRRVVDVAPEPKQVRKSPQSHPRNTRRHIARVRKWLARFPPGSILWLWSEREKGQDTETVFRHIKGVLIDYEKFLQRKFPGAKAKIPLPKDPRARKHVPLTLSVDQVLWLETSTGRSRLQDATWWAKVEVYKKLPDIHIRLVSVWDEPGLDNLDDITFDDKGQEVPAEDIDLDAIFGTD